MNSNRLFACFISLGGSTLLLHIEFQLKFTAPVTIYSRIYYEFDLYRSDEFSTSNLSVYQLSMCRSCVTEETCEVISASSPRLISPHSAGCAKCLLYVQIVKIKNCVTVTFRSCTADTVNYTIY